MLGYGTETKAYRLYDIEREKIIFSRDVVINKTIENEQDTRTVDAQVRGMIAMKLVPMKVITLKVRVRTTSLQPLDDRQENEENPIFLDSEQQLQIIMSEDPTTLEEAMTRSDKAKWVTAMEKEMTYK